MRPASLLTLAFATLSIAACEAPESLGPGFGNSVRHNMAMHIINPDPPTSESPAPDLYGERGANAMDRYTTDQAEQLQDVRTSDM